MNRSLNYSWMELEMLVTCLEENYFLVTGEFGPDCQTQSDQKRIWKEVAMKVNSVSMGAQRTPRQIKSKWSDLKYRVKQKALKFHEKLNTERGIIRYSDFNPMEQRILNLIGISIDDGVQVYEASEIILQEHVDDEHLENSNAEAKDLDECLMQSSSDNPTFSDESNTQDFPTKSDETATSKTSISSSNKEQGSSSSPIIMRVQEKNQHMKGKNSTERVKKFRERQRKLQEYIYDANERKKTLSGESDISKEINKNLKEVNEHLKIIIETQGDVTNNLIEVNQQLSFLIATQNKQLDEQRKMLNSQNKMITLLAAAVGCDLQVLKDQ